MFEDQTKAAILQRMLDGSPSDIDKRQGSPTYDLLSPAAIEIALAYIELNNVLNFGFTDTTYGPYLDARASEYGLTRKPAAVATGQVTFSGPPSQVIPAGTRVSTGGSAPVYFVTAAAVTIGPGGSATVAAEALSPGAAGNVSVGAINAVTGNLVGIITVTNAANFEGGADAETDDALRARILERAARPATSGNAAHYRQWALEVPGVSDAKVYPVWDGPLTVKVVLLGDDKTAPDPSIVAAAAAHIEEVRPIGADVTVEAAAEVAINVSATLTLAPGGSLPEARDAIEAGIIAYLASIAFIDPIVRYSQIANIILNTAAVIDYSALTVNGGTANINVPDGAVAVVGTVVVT